MRVSREMRDQMAAAGFYSAGELGAATSQAAQTVTSQCVEAKVPCQRIGSMTFWRAEAYAKSLAGAPLLASAVRARCPSVRS